jgi:hypothetical protein
MWPASILIGLLPQATVMTVCLFDKIGFDLDVIGRNREIASIEEKARVNYEKAGISVNIAVWNMHVPENHQFEKILDSGLQPMGCGGGFRKRLDSWAQLLLQGRKIIASDNVHNFTSEIVTQAKWSVDFTHKKSTFRAQYLDYY